MSNEKQRATEAPLSPEASRMLEQGLEDARNQRTSEAMVGPHEHGCPTSFSPPGGCLCVPRRVEVQARLNPGFGGLVYDDLVIACRNIGYDLTCGACASVFFCGMGLPHDKHTCAAKDAGTDDPRTGQATVDPDLAKIAEMTDAEVDAELRAMGADPAAVGDMGVVAAYLGRCARFQWPGEKQARELQRMLAEARLQERRRCTDYPRKCINCATGLTQQERAEFEHLRQRNRDMHDRAQKAEVELARLKKACSETARAPDKIARLASELHDALGYVSLQGTDERVERVMKAELALFAALPEVKP